MNLAFAVVATPRFLRDFARLAKEHPELEALFPGVLDVLSSDPANRSRGHPIKRLYGIPEGDGSWRLRARRFRFLYDIDGGKVRLKYCMLRREDTYR